MQKKLRVSPWRRAHSSAPRIKVSERVVCFSTGAAVGRGAAFAEAGLVGLRVRKLPSKSVHWCKSRCLPGHALGGAKSAAGSGIGSPLRTGSNLHAVRMPSAIAAAHRSSRVSVRVTFSGYRAHRLVPSWSATRIQ